MLLCEIGKKQVNFVGLLFLKVGFGNRLQVLVSGFLFALITDRALLVDWPDETTMQHWNGEEVVAMKAISNFFLEPDFDWDYSKHKERIEQQILAGNLTDTKMEYGGRKLNNANN